MSSPSSLSLWLSRQSGVIFSAYAMLAAFLTYCSMYAFRKPYTAAEFENLEIWGIDYKIVLVIAQVLGYTLSKFIGIKVVSEMSPADRMKSILVLIGFAWLALLLFGLVPYPYNWVLLFFNGLPLGMIWGIVFSFLEGRRFTEMLGAGMSASFIVSSGFVKAVGRALMIEWDVSAFWMPFLTGLLFIPVLLLGVSMLAHIPPPTSEDKRLRTQRIPMDKRSRIAFGRSFAPGILLVVCIYVLLTVFRDIRDNFAVELWAAIGYAEQSEILALSEIPIAIGVLLITGLMMYIRSNRIAFYANFFIIISGGLILLVTTRYFALSLLEPAPWMILSGFGMYLAYIAYHTMLFERWIALFQYPSNLGFLMYVADSFGYLGSVSILFFKNFGAKEIGWLAFFKQISYITAIGAILLGILAIAYFMFRERTIPKPLTDHKSIVSQHNSLRH